MSPDCSPTRAFPPSTVPPTTAVTSTHGRTPSSRAWTASRTGSLAPNSVATRSNRHASPRGSLDDPAVDGVPRAADRLIEQAVARDLEQHEMLVGVEPAGRQCRAAQVAATQGASGPRD